MAVVTISREYGSEGATIARNVADILGYHFVDKEFIGTVLNEYGIVEYDREYDTLPGFWEQFIALRDNRRETMVEMLNQVVQALACHGDVVILGRSGYAILAGYSDVLHVRLQAPITVRMERVMSKQHVSASQAEMMLKENDKVRLAFVEEFYRMPWGAIHAFDLVINTGKVPPEAATRWIVDAVKNFMPGLEAGGPSARSVHPDPILTGVISERLQCSKWHWR